MAESEMSGDVQAAPLSRRTQGALAAIVIAYAALAVLYSYATRLKWGPDEPAHFVYVQSLALDRRRPALGDHNVYLPGNAISHQRQQPPLYYAAAAVAYRALDALPADAIWRGMRFFSILLGLGALGLQWRLVRLLFPKDPAVCLASLAVLAFLPMFTYITAVVSNDPMATLLFTAVMYQWCRMLAGKGDLGNVAAAGLLVGLAVLAKESALALVPGLLIVAATTGGGRRTLAGRAGRAGLALIAAAVVCSGWFAHNVRAYGSPTVYFYDRPFYGSLREALAHPMGTRVEPGLVAVLGTTVDRTFLFLWVPWWATSERIPKTPYVAGLGLLSVVAFIGVVLGWVDRRRGRPGLTVIQSQAVALITMTVVMLGAGILRYVLFVDYTALQAGRYFIVVWPMLAILGVTGLWTLLVRPRARVIGLAVLVGAWLAGNGATLWLVHLTYGR